MIAVLLIASTFAIALFGLVLFRRHADAALGEGLETAWAAALAHEDSQMARILISVSRPIAQLPQVHLDPESSAYRSLRRKLAACGNLFGGSVEVFLSVQVLAALVAAGVLAGGIIAQVSGLLLMAIVLIAGALGALPYSRLHTASKKRAEAVAAGLPEFAEMLLMPVSSGYGVIPALDFTASRLEGPVASEVKLMIQVLSSRAASEQQAFHDCGERLGIPAAVTFFNTLYQSYTEGVKVADNIRGQAEHLRKQAYERTRARLKALPNKLVIIMGLHLIPFIFAVVLLPTFTALGNL